MPGQRLIEPDINPEWYQEDAEARRLEELDALQAGWDADNSGYNESDPASKSANGNDETDDVSNLEAAEVQAETDDGQRNEDTALADNESKNNEDFSYNNENEKSNSKLKNMITKKRASMAGGIAAVTVSLVIGIVVLLPQLIVNNLREWVIRRTGRVQSSQAINYTPKLRRNMSDLFTVKGRRGIKVINKLQTLGHQFSFDKEGKIVSYKPPGVASAITGSDISTALEKSIDNAYPVRNLISKNWKTKAMNRFYTRYGVTRSPPVDIATAEELKNPAKTLNSRLSKNVLEGQDGVTDATKPAAQGNTPEERSANAAKIEDAAPYASDSATIDSARTDALEGVASERLAAVGEIGPTPGVRGVSFISRLTGSDGALNFLKSLTITGTVDKFCTARNRLNAASKAGRFTRAMSLIRYSTEFVAIADAVHRGKVTPALMAVAMSRVTSKDSRGRAFGDSEGLRGALLGKFNKNKSRETKGNIDVSGDLGGGLGDLKDRLNNIPGCSIAQNPFAQIIEPVAHVVVAAATGGEAEAGAQGAIQTIKTALLGYFKNIFTRDGIESIIRQNAINFGFEEAMGLVQVYAEKTMKLNFTQQERGGSLADILFAGGGTANKQRWLQAGYVPATTDEFQVALANYEYDNTQDFKELGLLDRLFSLQNDHSLAYQLSANTVVNMPLGVEGIAAIPTRFINFASSSLMGAGAESMIANIVGGSAYAQATNSEEVSFDSFKLKDGIDSGKVLATDSAGNSQVIMRADIEKYLDDPLGNQEFLVKQGLADPATFQPIGAFESHVINCVNTPDTFSTIETHKDPLDITTDCLANNELTKRLKAHLAWLDAQDSVDADILPEDIGDSNAGASLTGNPTVVDCTSAQGNGKIICAAQAYTGIRYAHVGLPNAMRGGSDPAAWLQNNGNDLSILRSSAYVECSGFAKLSLWIAYSYKTRNGCSRDYAADTDPNIKSIVSPSSGKKLTVDMLQAGDFLTISNSCNSDGSPGHVGIFVKNNGDGTYTTLESSGATNSGGSKTSGFYIHQLSKLGGSGAHDFKYAGRYVGPGSGPP